jgi:hypothetical protein
MKGIKRKLGEVSSSHEAPPEKKINSTTTTSGVTTTTATSEQPAIFSSPTATATLAIKGVSSPVPSSNAVTPTAAKKKSASFSSADVFFCILGELQKYGIEVVSLDSPLFQLEVNEILSSSGGGHRASSALSLLVLFWSLLIRNNKNSNENEKKENNNNNQQEIQLEDKDKEEKEDQNNSFGSSIPDLSVHFGRSASLVASEYLKSVQDSARTIENQLTLVRKESQEKHRKRWETLLSTSSSSSTNKPSSSNNKKGSATPTTSTSNTTGSAPLSLNEIPSFLDRIPNPFGSLGADFTSWAWLTNSDNNSDNNNSNDGTPSEVSYF